MTGFCVYRYIDTKTNEIVYIGKTKQLFVTDRIEQHKTDNVGIWTQSHEYTVDFISLPQEEDMDYLESYLIRKYNPKLNIILSGVGRQAPFDIIIPEENWKNLKQYLKEKEDLKNKQTTLFAKNILAVKESNDIFKKNINKIKSEMLMDDIHFILKCYHEQIKKYTILPETCVVSINFIKAFYDINENNIEKILDRLLSYSINSRIEGTTNLIKKIGIYNSYTIKNEKCIFVYNPYAKKILDSL